MVLLETSILALAANGVDFVPSVDVLTPQAVWVEGSIDDQGVFRNRAGEDLAATALAWLPRESLDSPPPQRPFAVLAANDGQRVPGAFGGFIESAPGKESTVRWKHLGFGMIDLPTQQIASIQFQPTRAMARATDSDELVLRNGDVVRGFVERFAEPLIVDSGGVRHEISVDRVASLALVSPTQPQGAVRVWITDGSVIDGTAIRVVRSGTDTSFIVEGMPLIPGHPPLALMPQEILGVQTSATRILALSSLTPAVTAPTTPALPRAEYPAPRVEQRDAPFAASSLEIRGPLRLVYEIPQGFTTLNMTAEMPPSARTWGDCVIVVRQAHHELARHHLWAPNPIVQIGVPIHSGQLEIELEEGAGGPIADVVNLKRAILVIADGQG